VIGAALAAAAVPSLRPAPAAASGICPAGWTSCGRPSDRNHSCCEPPLKCCVIADGGLCFEPDMTCCSQKWCYDQDGPHCPDGHDPACGPGEVCVHNTYCQKKCGRREARCGDRCCRCGDLWKADRKTTFVLPGGRVGATVEKGALVEFSGPDLCSSYIRLVAGKILVKIVRAIEGPKGHLKFEVGTDRAVTGARGTTFWISHNRAQQLTRVGVTDGVVELRGRNGAKGKILIRKGQLGEQRGKSRPRLVRR
jgi:hypothetical protein